MRFINRDHISVVEVHLKKKNEAYLYYEGRKKRWYLKGEDPGMYKMVGLSCIKFDPVKEKWCYISESGKEVFYRPHIALTLQNKDIHELYFNNEEELEKYLSTEPLVLSNFVKFGEHKQG